MRLRVDRCALRAGLAAAVCVGLAGCTGMASKGPQGAAPALPKAFSPQAANAAILPGQSKDEVRARLGQASTVRFDSGYEVWAYRTNPYAEQGAGTEFVILFSPSGTVRKTRMRLPGGAPAG